MPEQKADPGAIDLEAIKFHHSRPAGIASFEVDSLVAEIEALRERVAKLNDRLNEHESMLAKSRHETNNACRKLKATEARVVELAGALEFYASRSNHDAKVLQSGFGRSNVSEDDGFKARAVLAATPAEALERTRAFGLLEEAVRIAWQSNWTDRAAMTEALAKLDALGKEKQS